MEKTNRTRDKPAEQKKRTLLPDDWCFIGGAGLLTSGFYVWLGLAAALLAAGGLLIAAGWLIARSAGKGGGDA